MTVVEVGQGVSISRRCTQVHTSSLSTAMPSILILDRTRAPTSSMSSSISIQLKSAMTQSTTMAISTRTVPTTTARTWEHAYFVKQGARRHLSLAQMPAPTASTTIAMAPSTVKMKTAPQASITSQNVAMAPIKMATARPTTSTVAATIQANVKAILSATPTQPMPVDPAAMVFSATSALTSLRDPIATAQLGSASSNQKNALTAFRPTPGDSIDNWKTP